jgi:shikimate kinase
MKVEKGKGDLMEADNIVLIGMPGAGKSTIGIVLAKTLKKPFLDTDLLIQQREDELLQDIINKKGIAAFLKIEEEVVAGLNVKNHVIATGGSVVYSPLAMGALKEAGTLVYLPLAFEEIQKRIRNITTRGIAMNQGQSLKNLYHERLPLYEKYADIIVDCAGLRDEQVIAEIKNKLEK